MSTCTTHFHACDCREEKFKQLQERLDEAEEVVKFYADHRNSNHPSDMETHESMMFIMTGKRARDYLKKWSNK